MICVQHYKYHCKKNASVASYLFFRIYSEKIDWQMHLTTDEKYQSSRIKTTLDVVWFKKKSWPSVLAIQMRRVYWCGRFRKSYWCLPFFLQRPRPSPPLLPFLDGHWFPSSLPLSAQEETDAFSSWAARARKKVSSLIGLREREKA